MPVTCLILSVCCREDQIPWTAWECALWHKCYSRTRCISSKLSINHSTLKPTQKPCCAETPENMLFILWDTDWCARPLKGAQEEPLGDNSSVPSPPGPTQDKTLSSGWSSPDCPQRWQLTTTLRGGAASLQEISKHHRDPELCHRHTSHPSHATWPTATSKCWDRGGSHLMVVLAFLLV